MHEDGCVVETEMYQTLVAAFSVKNVLGRSEGNGLLLPGERLFIRSGTAQPWYQIHFDECIVSHFIVFIFVSV